MPQRLGATVTSLENVADRTIALDLTPHEPFTFLPGQYLSLDVPADDRHPRPARRPYSIWSHPDEDGPLRLLIRLIPGGRASSWFETLRGGEEVVIRGPYGSFLLREPPAPHLWFVATGTGLAPLRVMLLELLGRSDDATRIHLDLGFRHERDVFGTDELDALAAAHDRFDYLLTLSRPGPSWTGAAGRVTDHWAERDPDSAASQAYLCGSGPMIEEMTELLVLRGMPRGSIFTEKYYN